MNAEVVVLGFAMDGQFLLIFQIVIEYYFHKHSLYARSQNQRCKQQPRQPDRTWIHDRAVWNEEKIRRLFVNVEAKETRRVSISPCREDILVWGNHYSGVYSARSGYQWFIPSCDIMILGNRRRHVRLFPRSKFCLKFASLHGGLLMKRCK
ncbi:hypothetical protein F3Y22_tig00000738pilonHSYRG00232 [Hibiscus syriacus]|uniref:Uncharacterized protein n=1 Tax=Hibiscus syriacus TaxID=106335 RepID=A0A6A3D618_HIBSY|nr:hypothetical protein F3Y22_tig00000738pilonHSYRG00232 [Hibiscus syriacus]